uniref:Uncharacterized protein n=1 Tax=Rhizophora mucronata TaxID=61149 RepID=A0A2P2JM74_RHIMU
MTMQEFRSWAFHGVSQHLFLLSQVLTTEEMSGPSRRELGEGK